MAARQAAIGENHRKIPLLFVSLRSNTSMVSETDCWLLVISMNCLETGVFSAHRRTLPAYSVSVDIKDVISKVLNYQKITVFFKKTF